MADTRRVLKTLGYDLRSKERERRPSREELIAILEHYVLSQA
jgi:hypothetical protein